MKKFDEKVSILLNDKVAKDIYKLEFVCPQISECAKAGQFVEVLVEANPVCMLRVPLCIADVDLDLHSITLYYAVVGESTKQLSQQNIGDGLKVLGPLGNGWQQVPQLENAKNAMIVCGGMGAAAVYLLAHELSKSAQSIDIVCGFATKNKIILKEEFENLALLYENPNIKLHICTDDGSFGFSGYNVVKMNELLQQKTYDSCFVCGPPIMTKIACKQALDHGAKCFASFEKLMACGLGVCLGCVLQTKNGLKRVCADGPVFDAEIIDWENFC
ncbi:MAG: dihydroorotate dehydrogenase electron transfer subunit [Coriobacteriales bacterium]|nr:dihydroorotate dehydrogenase electron transfer subunit [Coriobacteriales bacterium]